jgi:glyoxalase/bleomycin resistance protein/dioxygenase superfamily protein
MKVLFIAGFGPISADVEASRELYEDAFGIGFKLEDGDYRHTEELKGAGSFAIWPLEQAAESCFGAKRWPADVARPQAWLEFDVDDVAAATSEMEARGYRLLVANRTEPWGQVVSRLISPEGLLVGLTMTPWMRTAGSG